MNPFPDIYELKAFGVTIGATLTHTNTGEDHTVVGAIDTVVQVLTPHNERKWFNTTELLYNFKFKKQTIGKPI